MNHLKLFDSFLLEYLNTDDIYGKYYSDIPKDDYNKIVESDPTFKSDKKQKGIYTQWLLDLYKAKKLPLEDIYKATNYLKIYQKFKHAIKADFNNLKSLQDLYELVEPFEEKEEYIFSNDEERRLSKQFKEVFRNSKYRIIIPFTLGASRYFGKGTQWCTTNTDQFKFYTKTQTEDITVDNLYIFYTENPDERLQFHFREEQFMNIKDFPINTHNFFIENKDLFEFFDKYFPVLRYTNPYEFFKKGERMSENDKNALEFVDSIFKRLKKVKSKEFPEHDYFIDVKEYDMVYMMNPKTGNLWCLYSDFWVVLEDDYNLKKSDIQAIINHKAEQYFKLVNLTPEYVFGF